MSPGVPERIRWTVARLDVAPDDRILELGCGPGVAVSEVCARLGGGRVTAIDRSATAIARAARRNAEHVATGRAVLCETELEALAAAGELPFDDARFDKAFAVNVNLFWTKPAEAELRLLARLLEPGGVLHLVYEGPGAATGAPRPPRPSRAAETVHAALTAAGFAAEIELPEATSVACITGRVP